jgi:hypothetical protein
MREVAAGSWRLALTSERGADDTAVRVVSVEDGVARVVERAAAGDECYDVASVGAITPSAFGSLGSTRKLSETT